MINNTWQLYQTRIITKKKKLWASRTWWIKSKRHVREPSNSLRSGNSWIRIFSWWITVPPQPLTRQLVGIITRSKLISKTQQACMFGKAFSLLSLTSESLHRGVTSSNSRELKHMKGQQTLWSKGITGCWEKVPRSQWATCLQRPRPWDLHEWIRWSQLRSIRLRTSRWLDSWYQTRVNGSSSWVS
jgi:hypothetical protein